MTTTLGPNRERQTGIGARRGPHGGVFIDAEGGGIEIGIYKRGMPPRFELFFYDALSKPVLPPVGVALEVRRPDGRRQTFRFARYGHCLESTADVPGPHEFSLRLTVPRDGSMLVHNVRFTRYPATLDTDDHPEPDPGDPPEEHNGAEAAGEGPWQDRLRRLLFPGVGRHTAGEGHAVAGRVSALLLSTARGPTDEAMAAMETSPDGLGETEVERRGSLYGSNEVGQETQHGWGYRLWTAVRNPLVVLLTALALISYATDDVGGGSVMLLMVVLGLSLRLYQENRADNAAAKLRAMIRVTATVFRGGKPVEIPLRELVPGDVVKLAAGDMIPADVRLVSAKDLFVIQASLTGESLPVEKADAPDQRPGISPLELSNVCFLGTSVESGTATAVVAATGAGTYFGSMAQSMTAAPVETSFDRGVNRFTWLMIRFMMVMVPLVFLINGLTKGDWLWGQVTSLFHEGHWLRGALVPLRYGDWKEAFLFALAVAVGLTPEMLPMIVSVGLSKGAMLMSRKKVIVKRLNAIQNFGAMDVLCTDKTGTLTLDHVVLEKYCDVVREENEDVLLDAYLISHFQTGLKNILDRAILNHKEVHGQVSLDRYAKVDEIPFDFVRRMMSVVVRKPEGGNRLLAKGAPEEIYRRCTHFEIDGEVEPMSQLLIDDLKREYEQLSADGFRVLAVAYRDVPDQPAYSKSDECDLVLKGYVAFLDPPKESASAAIKALHTHGVSVKVLTGDNDLVARKVCREVGLDTQHVLLGADVEKMDDEQLADAAEATILFARLSPAHKQRIVKALQNRKHVVGFMGDGINDSPALRAADVGISVDSAVDIAKESADLILLEKDLMVLEQGVIEGRKVFANILKYIRMGASSNFGNMFSMLGASALYPFLPMLPKQVLFNNLLYDFSQVPIPTDAVDEEQVARPRPWNIEEIRRFILFIGPISSIFDYTTYFVMWYVFKCYLFKSTGSEHYSTLFQTGWFVESLMTQTLIIHVIRTNKVPFLQSRASLPLTLTSLAIMAFGAWLPFSPMAGPLGLTALPGLYWPILFLTLLCYVGLTQIVKMWLLRLKWI
jgi:Mg2+-importing ATPase